MAREINVRVWIIPEQRYANNKNDEIHYHRWCDMKSGEWYVTTAKGVLYEGEDIIVEQDTGLKDKNGKEIHEGDIVVLSPEIRYADSFIMGENLGQPPLVVEFDDGEWLLSKKPYNGFQNVLYQEEGLVEVIGNIHENSKLLNS